MMKIDPGGLVYQKHARVMKGHSGPKPKPYIFKRILIMLPGADPKPYALSKVLEFRVYGSGFRV